MSSSRVLSPGTPGGPGARRCDRGSRCVALAAAPAAAAAQGGPPSERSVHPTGSRHPHLATTGPNAGENWGTNGRS